MRRQSRDLFFLFLVVFAPLEASAQTKGALSVRIVDQSWQPLPGIAVQLARVENCLATAKSRASSESRTNRDGVVEFSISPEENYLRRQ